MGGSGGGSGGGGGSSGTVDYPQYMKDLHGTLYSQRLVPQVDLAISRNPYPNLRPQSPMSMVCELRSSLCWLDGEIESFDPQSLWGSLIETIPKKVIDLIETGPLDDFIDSQKQRLLAGVEIEILPKFRRGMQDIGAVNTSAFKIGEALIWSKAIEEVTGLEKEYKGKLSLAAIEYSFKNVDAIIGLTLQKLSMQSALAQLSMEASRIGYVGWKEYFDQFNVFRIEEVKWNLEINKYLMDALGSISASAGVSYSTSAGGVTRGSSAIGGAIAGIGTGLASTGGSPLGGVIGGAVGLIGGLFG